jgi:hypothetical protein
MKTTVYSRWCAAATELRAAVEALDSFDRGGYNRRSKEEEAERTAAFDRWCRAGENLQLIADSKRFKSRVR